MPIVLVVSLEASLNRRRFMERQLRRLGLPYRFVRARSVSDLTAAQLEALRTTKFRNNQLSPGEMACALSHSDACRALADQEQHEFGVIMEDDVIFREGFEDVVRALERTQPRDEVTLMMTLVFEPVNLTSVRDLGNGYRVCSPGPLEVVWGTQAYLLSRHQARRMSDALVQVRCRADDWWTYARDNILGGVSVVFPFPVLHAEFNSAIERVPPGKTSVFSRRTLSALVHRHEMFPLYQLALWHRRQDAERRQRKFLAVDGSAVAKTFRL